MDHTIFLGILTGLIPSLHPNNLVGLVSSDYLLQVAVVHSFINFIPNILFLVPDVYTITSLNASHLLYKRGLAFYALIISGISSFLGGVFSLLFLLDPFLFIFLKKQHFLIFLTLLFIIIFSFLLKDIKKFFITLFLFLSTFLVINLTKYFGLDYFLPIIGLFGLSSVLVFGKTKVKQEINLKIFKLFDFDLIKKIISFSILGVLFSIPANTFPLLTPTHFLIIFVIFLKFGLEESIILVSSMSTSDFVLSFITKYYFDYSRNYVVSNILLDDLNPFYLIFLFSIALFLFLITSIFILLIHNKLSKKILNFFVVLSIFIPFLINFSIYSILILIFSGFIGYLAIKNNIERITLFNSYSLDYLLKFFKIQELITKILK